MSSSTIQQRRNLTFLQDEIETSLELDGQPLLCFLKQLPSHLNKKVIKVSTFLCDLFVCNRSFFSLSSILSFLHEYRYTKIINTHILRWERKNHTHRGIGTKRREGTPTKRKECESCSLSWSLTHPPPKIKLRIFLVHIHGHNECTNPLYPPNTFCSTFACVHCQVHRCSFLTTCFIYSRPTRLSLLATSVTGLLIYYQ